MNDKTILHIDINNFYASVAILMNSELAGKPVIVCGDVERRHGIVLAKNELAKKAGIKTGDTIYSAEQKIKGLIKVPPDYKKYVEYSKRIFNIYTEYTPQVESFGLDECWLDVSGCAKLYGNGEEIAITIKNRIKEETGLTVSIGVAFSKIFAKLGSDMKKPDAITVITRENYKQKVWKQKVSELLFVGRHTEEKLNKMGVFTIGDLADYDLDALVKKFGKVGRKLHLYANGNDDEKVKLYTDYRIPESVGNGTTTLEDVTNIRDASSVIFALCEIIAFRLRGYGLVASVVSVNFRDKYLQSFSRQSGLDFLTDSAFDISSLALSILKGNYDFAVNPPLRTITVQVSNLMSAKEFVQQSLFEEEISKNRKLESSIDVLRKKYGFGILQRGITMGTVFTCDDKEIEDGFLPFNKIHLTDKPE